MFAACGGGGGSSTGGSNNVPTPSPINASGINIGNISTIPTGNNATNTFVVVTNNFSNTLRLTDGTYTIYNSAGNAISNDIRSANSPVNVTQCNTVQGNGTCSLQVTVPANSNPDGQYQISLNFINDLTGTIYSVSQVISYSSNVPSSQNGIIFSTINNTLYNQPGSATTYSVPFVISQTINSISAVSQYDNPAFTPAIVCSGVSPYPTGTLCTLYIHISDTGTNSMISGNILVSSGNGVNAQIKGMPIGIKGQTGFLFNVPVTVLQSNTGNLITSSLNTIINPADGTHPQTITLFNNGAGNVTGITVTAANPLSISSNSCGSLNQGTSCTFAVNATQTANGQAGVTITYTQGGSSYVLTFNVAYIGAAATPGLSMFTSGSLTNSILNNTSTLNITIKNTSSTTTLSSITLTPTSSLPSGMSYESNSGGVGSTCAIDGTLSLAPGAQCTLVVQYTPTSTVSSTSFTIREAAIYSNVGSSGSYTAANVSISYSAVTGNAFVYIKPSNVSFAIKAESSDLQTQTFTLVNASSISTQVTSESNSSPAVTAYPGTVGGTCGSFPRTLGAAGSGTESCTITTQFGPTTSTINTSSQMVATYIANATTGESASTYSFLTFVASPAALITVNNITVTGQSSGNGNGSPYLFTNSPTNVIQFTVTYRNSGTANATNFNVALNNLPIGYYVVESLSTCGRESTTSTLNTSSNCNVVFAAMSPIESYNPYAFTGAINVNIPGYSYTDTNTGLNTNSAPLFSPTYTSNTINVTAQTFGTATESTPPNWINGTSGGSNTLTFTSATTGLRITIPNSQQLTIFTLGGGGTCTISGGVCTILVTNPAGIPLQTYFFQYVVSPVGSSAGSAGIIKTGSFTYTQ